jgi:PKHD-type hydroxylase
MILSYNSYYFTSAISVLNCNRIIKYGKQLLEEDRRLGLKSIAVTLENTHIKKNKIPQNEKTLEELSKNLNLSTKETFEKRYQRDSEVTFFNDQWCYDLVYPLIDQANKESGWNFQYDYSESFQFTVYKPGGFYGWHADGNSDHNAAYKLYVPGESPPLTKDNRLPNGYTKNPAMIGKVRKLSLTINLSDPSTYEGGDLRFDHGPHELNRFTTCKEIKPQGSCVIFPSFTFHQVTPVTKGVRYSLVLWTLGYPFK